VKDRIDSIDALRGLALAGIGITHFGDQFLGYMVPHDHQGFATRIALDVTFEVLRQVFIVGKGYAIFSLLFGLSFALQMQRAERRDPEHDFRYRFAWRLTVLLVIGLLHSLFFAGDILLVYALLGLPLVLFYRVPDRWLLAIALLLLIGAPRVVGRLVSGPTPVAEQKAFMPRLEAGAVRHWQALESGDLRKIIPNNATDGLLNKWGYQMGFSGRGYQTFGFFLIGLWAGRRRIFETVEKHRAAFKRLLRWSVGLTVGLPLFMISLVMVGRAMGFKGPGGPEGGIPDLSSWLVIFGITMQDLWNNSMTLFYVAAFVLLFQRARWQALFARFAPIGRMALSCYLMQTLVGAFVFFGFGLGLLGRYGNSFAIPLGIAVVAAQTWLCPLWLRHFRYGPVEWVWRSLTWLRRQPFRVASPELTIARAA
jgi:uncharacterized protein